MPTTAEPDGLPLVLTRHEGPLALVTLNRPHKRNALNAALQSALVDTLGALAARPDARAVILTGAGPAFCAGLDLHDFTASLRGDGSRPRPSVFAAVEALPQPVIAAINGHAITGGFELALACDVLIASTQAAFADTHAALGVMPGAGLSQKLSRIVGLPRAMALSLSGEMLSAEEAYRWGLVSHLVPPEELLPLAWRLGQRMAQADPGVLRELKQVMRQGAALPLGAALELERQAHQRWAQGADLGRVTARRDKVMAHNRGQG